MLRVFILRHADATPYAGSGDRERGLSPQGVADASRMGAYLADQLLVPDAARVSDARRTRQTFELIQPNLPSDLEMTLEPRIYDASVGDLMAVARKTAASVRALLVIGHNPGLSEWAGALAGFGDRYAARRMEASFPAGSLAVFDFDIENWRDLKPRDGRLDRFVTPQDLV